MNWDSLDNITIFLIFGLILFPSEENFMDYTTINVLLAVKVGDEDPTSALLADVYYTFHQRHAKHVGMMLCCAPLLHKWFIFHLAKDMTTIEVMSVHKWAQYLVSLTDQNII